MPHRKRLIKEKIRTIPDFPKPGIQFRDITTLLKDSEGFSTVMELFLEQLQGKQVDVVAGIESRGFILAGALAARLQKGFIPIRKPGKLPAKTVSFDYDLEYGTDTLQLHEDAIHPHDKVILVDDLVATGGTMAAACHLIEKVGATISEILFIIDLPELGGRKKIKNYPHYWITEFDGE